MNEEYKESLTYLEVSRIKTQFIADVALEMIKKEPVMSGEIIEWVADNARLLADLLFDRIKEGGQE